MAKRNVLKEADELLGEVSRSCPECHLPTDEKLRRKRLMDESKVTTLYAGEEPPVCKRCKSYVKMVLRIRYEDRRGK